MVRGLHIPVLLSPHSISCLNYITIIVHYNNNHFMTIIHNITLVPKSRLAPCQISYFVVPPRQLPYLSSANFPRFSFPFFFFSRVYTLPRAAVFSEYSLIFVSSIPSILNYSELLFIEEYINSPRSVHTSSALPYPFPSFRHSNLTFIL